MVAALVGLNVVEALVSEPKEPLPLVIVQLTNSYPYLVGLVGFVILCHVLLH